MIDSLILVATCELQKFGINILEMFDIKKKKSRFVLNKSMYVYSRHL